MTAISTEHPHVVRDPEILRGQPVVRGSRISIAAIARMLNDGASSADIAKNFPHLSSAALYDALSYYYDHGDEIDEIIRSSSPEALAKEGYVVRPDGSIAFPNR